MLLCCYHEMSERNEVLLFVTKNHVQKILLVYLGATLSSRIFPLQRVGHFEKRNACSSGHFAFSCDIWRVFVGYHRKISTLFSALDRRLFWEHHAPRALVAYYMSKNKKRPMSIRLSFQISLVVCPGLEVISI
jgi:hypothetical protein